MPPTTLGVPQFRGGRSVARLRLGIVPDYLVGISAVALLFGIGWVVCCIERRGSNLAYGRSGFATVVMLMSFWMKKYLHVDMCVYIIMHSLFVTRFDVVLDIGGLITKTIMGPRGSMNVIPTSVDTKGCCGSCCCLMACEDFDSVWLCLITHA